MVKKFEKVVDDFVQTYGKQPEDVSDREVMGEASPRAKKQRDQFFTTKSSVSLEFPYWYTRQYMQDDNEIPVIRRARALKVAFSHLTPVIYPGELQVIKRARYFRGSYPMPWLTESGYLSEDDPWFKKAKETGATAAGEVTQFGEGGGNLTESTGTVVSIAGKYACRQEEMPAHLKLAEMWAGKSVDDVRTKYEPMVPGYETKAALMRSVCCIIDAGYTVPQGREVTDYYYPLQYGFDGLKQICEEKKAEVAGNADGDGILGMNRLYNYEAMILVIEGVQKWVNNYATEARHLATVTKDATQKTDYEEIADVLEWIEHHPPRTFREAFQMVDLVHLAVLNEDTISGLGPGRWGQALSPYFEQDIEAGRTTEEKVLELLELDRVRKTSIDCFGPPATIGGALAGSSFNTCSIGGVTIDNQTAANRLEHLMMQSSINCQMTQPTYCLLYDERLPEDFLLKAAECIKTGTGFPAIVNNRVAMDWLMMNFKDEGMTVRDARAVAIGGCLETGAAVWHTLTLNGKEYIVPGGASQPATGVHFVNLPKILELTLFNGKDHRTGEQVFQPHNDPLETYEALVDQYKRYWREALDALVKCNNVQLDIWRKLTPPVFNSVLKADCLEKGLLIPEKGVRYTANYVIETTGTANLANSAIALEALVYKSKKVTLEAYKDAILNNFGFKSAHETGNFSMAGQEKRADSKKEWDELHHLVLNAPKYGNDIKEADEKMWNWEYFFCNAAHDFKCLFGCGMFANQIATSTQAPEGAATLATPDGRLAGTTFADGSMSAYAGSDIKGPYALFRSAAGWDQALSQNTQMNFKLHPTAVKGPEGSKNLVDLSRGYMRLGGFHIQYNVVDSRMLKDAQKNPDQYVGLMVRVAGFTQFWAELGKGVQDEIIARTEYEEM
jgi:4-hydroxyphenylacetate decarboxylase large subunit